MPHGIMPSPASGHVPLLSMTKTSMMAKTNDQSQSEALFKVVDFDRDGGITGEGVQQLFTTNSQGAVFYAHQSERL